MPIKVRYFTIHSKLQMQHIAYRIMSIFATATDALMLYSHTGLIWQYVTKQLINVLIKRPLKDIRY